jgi:site-specific DNA-methyltransferase (adenine-specific)
MGLSGETTIINEDCRVAFKRLKANTVDLIATDPPYFLDGMGDDWSDDALNEKQSRARAIGGLPVGMKFDPNQGIRLQKFFKKVFPQAKRVLKPGGFMLCFSQGRLFHRMAIAAEEAGFEIRDLYIWEHQGGQGKSFRQDHFIKKMNISQLEKNQMIEALQGRKTPQLRPKFEVILLAQKPKDGTFVNNWMKWKTGLVQTDFDGQQSTMFSYKKSLKKIGHLTPKPVDLMERLIEVFSLPGQVVLDPFMGSGSTGVAALKQNRDFIGFEIEQKYFDIAQSRLHPHGKD